MIQIFDILDEARQEREIAQVPPVTEQLPEPHYSTAWQFLDLSDMKRWKEKK